jgi:hypothetical protein
MCVLSLSQGERGRGTRQLLDGDLDAVQERLEVGLGVREAGAAAAVPADVDALLEEAAREVVQGRALAGVVLGEGADGEAIPMEEEEVAGGREIERHVVARRDRGDAVAQPVCRFGDAGIRFRPEQVELGDAGGAGEGVARVGRRHRHRRQAEAGVGQGHHVGAPADRRQGQAGAGYFADAGEVGPDAVVPLGAARPGTEGHRLVEDEEAAVAVALRAQELEEAGLGHEHAVTDHRLQDHARQGGALRREYRPHLVRLVPLQEHDLLGGGR